jgi:hypothetical protein
MEPEPEPEPEQPQPEQPEPADEEAEPTAFTISVSSATGAKSFEVRATDTLGSLKLRIAEALVTPPDQQLLVLGDKPMQAHLLDTDRTLQAHGITGPVSLTLSPRPAPSAAQLKDAMNAQALASVRVAVEPCLQPAQMKLRDATGKHKHRRWFWLTVTDDLQLWVHWSPNEDGSDAWLWKSFKTAPHKQRRVTALTATPEIPSRHSESGLSYLGLTMEVEGDQTPVIVVAETEEQLSSWLGGWGAAEEAIAQRAAGLLALDAGEVTIDEVKAYVADIVRPLT